METLYEEIVRKVPAELLVPENRDFGKIAEIVSKDRIAISETFLTATGLIQAFTAKTGTMELSDSLLSKLDKYAANSPSLAVLVSRLKSTENGLDFADPSLRGWFCACTPSVFTETERDAILALAEHYTPVTVAEITYAMEGK
jgi:hypothetical protein